MTSDHDAAPARTICMPTGRQKTARIAGKRPCKQQLSPSKLCPHKLLHAPPSQHSTRDRMDGRTDGRSRRQSSRKLPFANGLADLPETKCSLTFCKMARAMEPTPTSDRHRNRPNSDPLLSLTGGSYSSTGGCYGRVGPGLRWAPLSAQGEGHPRAKWSPFGPLGEGPAADPPPLPSREMGA